MKLALVFTNDWELFGDGSGDYYDVQQKPLQESLALFKDYNAKITLMAETMQQLFHIESADQINKDIAQAWENSVLELIRSGHDVQLHIHPQWIGSRYDNGRWQLNMSNTSIGKMDDTDIGSVIRQCKAYLESLIVPVKNQYQCNIFRAGAYYIEPSDHVIKILIENGFIGDSSVTKGLVTAGYHDFSDAVSHFQPWKTKEDINKKTTAEPSLIELPIFSVEMTDSQVLKKFLPNLYYKVKFGSTPLPEEMDWMKEKDKIKNKRYPKENRFYKQNQKKDFNFYKKAIISKQPVQLDYDYLPGSIFVSILRKFFSKLSKDKKFENLTIPIVASGHFKDIHNCDNIKSILQRIKELMPEHIEYWTLSEAFNYIKNNPTLLVQ